MRIIGVIISFFLCVISYAQGVVTTNYTTAQGLITNDVRALCFDSKGILWIGSRSGLLQMVQEEIRLDEVSSKLRYTNVSTIVEDRNAVLWVGSYGQGVLKKVGKEAEVFTQKEGLVSNRVRILYASNYFIYVGTSDGISIINTKTSKIINPPFVKHHEHPFEVSAFFEINNKVYATTINDGVFLVENERLTKVNDVKRILSVYQQDNFVLYGNQKELVVENWQTKSKEVYPDLPAVQEFQKVGNYIYLVNSGIYENKAAIYRWNGKQLDNVTSELNLFAEDFESIAYDSNNNFLYVGSRSDGLFKIDLSSPLKHFQEVGQVMAMASNKEQLYVFSNRGLYLEKGNYVKQILPLEAFKIFEENHKQRLAKITTIENHFYEIDFTTPADKIIFYRAVAEKDAIWVSSNIGLFKLSKEGVIIDYFSIHTMQFAFYKGKLIETNPYGGIRVYHDLDKFDYTYYSRYNKNTPRDIVAIEAIDTQLFFGGALDGLYVLRENSFESLLKNKRFLEKRIIKLAKGPDHTLFVATDFNDIFQITTEQGIVKVVTHINNKELFAGGIATLNYLDEKLFVGTSKGLVVIDKQNNKFYFDKEQGLSNYDFSSSAVIGSKLYLGTKEGIYTLDTSYFQSKKNKLQFIINQIEVNGELYAKEVNQSEALHLPYNKNSLLINFNVLGAKYPEKLRFEYRLKQSENWQELKDSHLALNFLEDGRYAIEIRITDLDSGSTTIYPFVNIVIQPPFYATWWFVLLSIGGVVGATYIVYRFRVSHIKKQALLNNKKLVYEKRLAEVKLLSIRSQLNTHFIFNVLSSFQYFILNEQVDDALYYLDKFAKLIRKTLNFSQLNEVSLAEEIAYLEEYFEIENMRLEGRVQFHKQIETAINLQAIKIPPLLLQPFVENCLIHAFPATIKDPRMEIEVKTLGKDVVIYIKDNGKGNKNKREQNAKHESKGLGIVKERMSLIQEYMDNDLVVEQTEQGTIVQIVLRNKANYIV
ncbi:MAG: histidine kinase [Flavobacteriaceae bacterium]|jgi:ligand-binding sensor domain-containing protein|nr:histidine kinase [Flavobacteriaceae bacterium]